MFELTRRFKREQILLRITPHGKGVMIEREAREEDGGKATLAFPILSIQDFYAFVEADPQYDQLQALYSQCAIWAQAILANCGV
ncbi:hypothetical protein FZ025_17160 [Xanthomonas hyacinthi]|uniref:Uncharacterized protein n=1 Tax=Xanthomonas hyacinthi TaxID=56455 RepID=A0A2S7F1R6_9XANT|nr:hypothetical protein [Xanthomonas hyacinthi]KLD78887.1 hypothetical protein Y886_07760 [Xanthomonas hyacinthi DSM 19077]PPU99292.1 hypothetical protein XhyaCFBP1156_03210 [Xanthomonas hyacinthi]QGY78281.1 hypothetical protein FZ025_17160 [Xanthomonas hyacinthi]